MNSFKQQQFQKLEEINKQIFDTLKEKENVEYSQICFDILFSEFAKQIKELEKAGIHESEIQDFLATSMPKNKEAVANLAKYYDKFLKSGKKEVGQPN